MKKIIIGFLCLFFIACQSGQTKANKRPNWINNPQNGAVGSSQTHVMGRHEQEELAISRARTRLAARYGVTVDQVKSIREHASNNGGYTVSADSVTQQVIKNKTVKAHVRAIWYDKPKDTVWAWLYPIK